MRAERFFNLAPDTSPHSFPRLFLHPCFGEISETLAYSSQRLQCMYCSDPTVLLPALHLIQQHSFVRKFNSGPSASWHYKCGAVFYRCCPSQPFLCCILVPPCFSRPPSISIPSSVYNHHHPLIPWRDWQVQSRKRTKFTLCITTSNVPYFIASSF